MPASPPPISHLHSPRPAPRMSGPQSKDQGPKQKAPIWWSNAIFFVSMHIVAGLGCYRWSPPSRTPWKTLILCFVSWQCASFGITVGYHRLWSHRSFTARKSLRVVLAIMGSLGFQGSIKWWTLRHRLHHRYTDDPVHDPYSATHGLLFSHMGWIFRKPTYERLGLVDKSDLDSDPVVRAQHKYYVPIAISFGLVAPTLIATSWGDPMGGFLWGGVTARLLIWHCTFLINSLAHWEGLQLYSDEMSAKSNVILAMLTSGEGNHNYHTFPHDFRAGYDALDWDPSKWIIWGLYRYTSLVTSVKRADEGDVAKALAWMQKRHRQQHNPKADDISHKHHWTFEDMQNDEGDEIDDSGFSEDDAEVDPGHKTWENWDANDLQHRLMRNAGGSGRITRPILLLLDGWIVDATKYAAEHPGGAFLLRKYAIRRPDTSDENAPSTPFAGLKDGPDKIMDATSAFRGGLNNHSRNAVQKMKGLRVARFLGEIRS